jgi:CcmD family protein
MNWYLFFGYAVIWTLLFVYLVYLHRRQTALNRELRELERSLEE